MLIHAAVGNDGSLGGPCTERSGVSRVRGDADADGIPDILVGSMSDTDGGKDAGATWLVLGSPL